jgi:hypothetical protein
MCLQHVSPLLEEFLRRDGQMGHSRPRPHQRRTHEAPHVLHISCHTRLTRLITSRLDLFCRAGLCFYFHCSASGVESHGESTVSV